jgi:hypothetical protein
MKHKNKIPVYPGTKYSILKSLAGARDHIQATSIVIVSVMENPSVECAIRIQLWSVESESPYPVGGFMIVELMFRKITSSVCQPAPSLPGNDTPTFSTIDAQFFFSTSSSCSLQVIGDTQRYSLNVGNDSRRGRNNEHLPSSDCRVLSFT